MTRRLRLSLAGLSVLAALTTVQPALAAGFGEVGHFHYTNNTYQYLIYGGDLYQSYDSKGAYTNNQDTGTPFQGRAAYVNINYSGGTAQGIQIDSPVASATFPPGGYDYTTTEVLPGAGANAQWVQSVLGTHRVTITDTFNHPNTTLPGSWYAASDVTTLSGYTSAHGTPTTLGPWPKATYGLPPNTVESGSKAKRGNVALTPVPGPSIQITSVQDLTTGKPAADGVNPGDTLKVTNTVGANAAYSGWGAGALLAWFGWGTSTGTSYVNAFYGNSSAISVPMFGLGPAPYQQSYVGGQVQGQPQPGIAPQSSYTITVPNNAPTGSSMNLYLYSVDGIDRYAEATDTLNVLKPSISLLISPTTSQKVGSTFTLTATATNLPPNDYIQISSSGNATIATSVGRPNQTTLTTTATDNTAETDTFTAQIMQPGTPATTVGSPSTATATWTAPPPTFALTETPTTSQQVGQAYTLDAHTTNAQGGIVTFTQSGNLSNNGGPGTISGNYVSNQSSITYPTQSSSSYQYNPTATSSQAGPQTITATLTMPNGTILTKSIGQSWYAAAAVTLTANPTSLYDDHASTLTATATHLQSNEKIKISQSTSVGQGTLTGATQVLGAAGQTSLTASATYNGTNLQTITYTAAIVNAATGQVVAGTSSTSVNVTWTPATQPTLSLSASNTAPTTGSQVILSATASHLQSQYGIFIHDLSGANSINGSNVGGGSPGVNPESVTAVSNTTRSVQYVAKMDWLNPATGQVQIISSQPVTVTWGGTPGLTLRASTTNAIQGSPVTLTATGSGLPASYTIQITDQGSANTLGGTSTASAPDTNPYSTTAVSSSPITNEPYQAQVYNSAGQLVTSNVVYISWSAPAGPPGLSLSAASPTEPVGTADTLTAAGTNVSSGDTIVITQMNTNGGDTFGSAGQTTGAGQYQVSSTSDPYAVAVNDVSGQNGYQATYGAIAVNNSGQTVAQSNNVAVSWGSNNGPPSITITANPQVLQINKTSVLSVSASNVPLGDYVIIYPNSPNSGQWWTNAAVYVGQQTNFSGSYSATASVSQSQPTSVTYYAVVENPSGGNPPNDFVTAASTTVLWTPPAQSVTLSPSNQTLPLGQGGFFTVTEQYIPSNEEVTIWNTNGQIVANLWNNTSGYYSGTTQEYAASPGAPTTEGFYATVAASGASIGNSIAITWTNQPSATLTASPTNPLVGQYSDLVATAQNIPPAFYGTQYGIGIENLSTGTIVASQLDTASGGGVGFQALQTQAESQTYAPVIFAQGAPAQISSIVYTGTPVTVTWIMPAVSITSPATSYQVGQLAPLTATSTPAPNGGMSYLFIVDAGNHYTLPFYSSSYGSDQVEGYASPFSTTADFVSFLNGTYTPVPGSDQYYAEFQYFDMATNAFNAVKSPPDYHQLGHGAIQYQSGGRPNKPDAGAKHNPHSNGCRCILWLCDPDHRSQQRRDAKWHQYAVWRYGSVFDGGLLVQSADRPLSGHTLQLFWPVGGLKQHRERNLGTSGASVLASQPRCLACR